MDSASQDSLRDAVQAQGAALGQVIQQLEVTSRSLQSASSEATEARRLAEASSSRVALGDPERYYGEAARLDSFVNHLKLKFELEASCYPSE